MGWRATRSESRTRSLAGRCRPVVALARRADRVVSPARNACQLWGRSPVGRSQPPTGRSMGDDAGNALSRRQFGQWLGAAALAGALPEMARAMPSDERVPRGPAHDETSAIGPHVTGDEICDLTAVDLAARIRRKQ